MGKIILLGALAAIVDIALTTWLAVWLWNLTLPSIFEGTPSIGGWQGFGLVLLARLLTAGPSIQAKST